MLASEPLPMERLIRRLALGVALVTVHCRSNVLSHPSHNGMIDWELAFEACLKSGLVSPKQVFELLHCVLCLTVGLRFPNGRGLRHHLHQCRVV